MYQAFLIKYAEIGIKGKNRYMFEDALKSQIIRYLKGLEGDFHVSKEQGRIYVEAQSDFDYDGVVERLKNVFGISGFCPVVVIPSTKWEDVTRAAGDYIENAYEDKDFTFKVFAKRGDKSYPIKSPEICTEMGAYLLKRFPDLKVDVHSPQVKLSVEIRKMAYIYSEEIKGPGGMPVGTNGKAMLLLSGGIDSPVAGYMIAKRGVSIEAVYFHAPPYTSERAKQKVIDLAAQVSKYAGPIKLHVVDFTKIQMYIYDKCPHEELTIIMRRYMMRIAEAIAKENKCMGLITGESIGQVASQTMQSLMATDEVCSLPVFRPVIGFDKQEIVDVAQRIGTYETSVLPFEDCCTIFVAKHPVTRPNLKVIRASEGNLAENIDAMVAKALETKETIMAGDTPYVIE